MHAASPPALSFQSTLPVRGATSRLSPRRQASRISIHAPRAGSDRYAATSLRGCLNFNPRSPCGERRMKIFLAGTERIISIHAPRAGSDQLCHSARISQDRFQSTLPVRGATKPCRHYRQIFLISIHAPRAGSDKRHAISPRGDNISIHAPRAGSDGITSRKANTAKLFQSTLPVRGATRPLQTDDVSERKFQSTLPVRGATPLSRL